MTLFHGNTRQGDLQQCTKNSHRNHNCSQTSMPSRPHRKSLLGSDFARFLPSAPQFGDGTLSTTVRSAVTTVPGPSTGDRRKRISPRDFEHPDPEIRNLRRKRQVKAPLLTADERNHHHRPGPVQQLATDGTGSLDSEHLWTKFRNVERDKATLTFKGTPRH